MPRTKQTARKPTKKVAAKKPEPESSEEVATSVESTSEEEVKPTKPVAKKQVKKTATKPPPKTGRPTKKVEVSEDTDESSEEPAPRKPVTKKTAASKKKVVEISETASSESSEESSEPAPKKNPVSRTKKSKAVASEEESLEEKPKKSLSKTKKSKVIVSEATSEEESVEKSKSKKGRGKKVPAPKKTKKDLTLSKSKKSKSTSEYETAGTSFSESQDLEAGSEEESLEVSAAPTPSLTDQVLEMKIPEFIVLINKYFASLEKKKDIFGIAKLRGTFGLSIAMDSEAKSEKSKVQEVVAPVKEKKSEAAKTIEEAKVPEGKGFDKVTRKEYEQGVEDLEKSENVTVEPVDQVGKDLAEVEESISFSEQELKHLLGLYYAKKTITDEELVSKSGLSVEKIYYFRNHRPVLEQKYPEITTVVARRSRLFK